MPGNQTGDGEPTDADFERAAAAMGVPVEDVRRDWAEIERAHAARDPFGEHAGETLLEFASRELRKRLGMREDARVGMSRRERRAVAALARRRR